MLFTNLLASPWRWVLLALAILLAIAFGSQGLDYASTWLARRRAAKAVHTTEASHDARAAAEPARLHHFDSLLFTRIGQHRELAITLAKIKHLDDSLHHRLPVAPALPADPPRQ
jgi:hypothetical protein